MRKNLQLYFCIIGIVSLTHLSFSLSAQTPHLDSLLKVVVTMKEDTHKINTYSEIVRAFINEMNDMEKMEEYGEKQYTLAVKLNFKKGIAYGTFSRGIYHWSKGNYYLALENYKKALPIMQELGIKKGESSCYLNIGQTYSELGNYKEALQYMIKGVKVKEQMNDKLGMSKGYNNIGIIYLNLGDYTQSLTYQLKGLKLIEEIDDKVGLSLAYSNIGSIFYAQKKLDAALTYFKKSEKVNDEIGVSQTTSRVYSNMGNIYADKSQYKEALMYYIRDLKEMEKEGSKQGIALANSNIATIYLKQKNVEPALHNYLRSYKLYKEIGDKKGLIDVSGGIGNLYEAKGDFTKALDYDNQMLQLAKELKYKEGIRKAYGNLASVYKQQKKFEKALEYTLLLNEVKDSLLNKENFKQVIELNTRYETDKKEKEILLLTKDQELNAKIIKQQKLQRWGLIGGLLLLFISVFSIYRRYRFKQKANLLLEEQKKEIEQKNILITDSIEYAKTIQEAVLPTDKKMMDIFPESFVAYKPKSVVSGDFYWLGKHNDLLVCAVTDCTGHGVPGAFMSLMGYNMLENVIKKQVVFEPSLILDDLNTTIRKSLATEEEKDSTKHGMDISLIRIDPITDQLQYAGAHQSIYIVREKELIELLADKKGIGTYDKKQLPFINQTIQLKKGDMIYLFTDGFPDQIGGPKRKKFYYQPFKDLLISISSLEMKVQQQELLNAHAQWQGDKMEQTDDILILGIRYR